MEGINLMAGKRNSKENEKSCFYNHLGKDFLFLVY